MNKNTKAILWDFGGVITASPFEAFSTFEKSKGLKKDFIRNINATNPNSNAWAKFESNSISIEEFDTLFREESSAAGHPINGTQILELLSGDIRPTMVNALKKCKEKYKVACITNNMKTGFGAGMTRDTEKSLLVDEVMTIFDEVIESSIEGVRKPNPRIFEIACDRIQVNPSDCVFLDDLGINLKPARTMGMTTIKVINQDQALRDLSLATGISFD